MTRPIQTRDERNRAVSRLVNTIYRAGQTEAAAVLDAARRRRDDQER